MQSTLSLARSVRLARCGASATMATRIAVVAPRRAAMRNALMTTTTISRKARFSAAVAVRASSSNGDSEVSTPVLAAAAAGLPASLIVLWSAYTKATTGEGLQGDVLGGLEGISYLLTLAVVGLSVKKKVDTGSGLPAGPGGLVGASEGLNFLALVAAIGAFAYSAVSK